MVLYMLEKIGSVKEGVPKFVEQVKNKEDHA